jgi:excisionase family DNA binding protein
MNLSEAAKHLGYSVPGFRKIMRDGRGPRFKRAGKQGHFRFKQEWLDEWLEQGADEPAAPAKRKKKPKPTDILTIDFGISPEFLDAA